MSRRRDGVDLYVASATLLSSLALFLRQVSNGLQLIDLLRSDLSEIMILQSLQITPKCALNMKQKIICVVRTSVQIKGADVLSIL